MSPVRGRRPDPRVADVRPVHRTWQRRTRWALSALLLAALPGAAAATSGCSNGAGQGEACGWGLGCANGLVCMDSRGTCEPAIASSSYCELRGTGCGSRDGYLCHGGGTPNDPYETGCTAAPSPDDAAPGVTLYCCTYVPHCGDYGPCGDAGRNLQCDDPVIPQASDPSLECATIFSRGDGWSSYCCAQHTACFSAILFGCGDAGQSYACVGDATPSRYQLACTSGAYDDAGARGTYCCESDAGSN